MRNLQSRLALSLTIGVALVFVATSSANAQGFFYTVNTTSDSVMVGACQNGNPGCSLRGAIQTANANPGADGIGFDLPAGSIINLAGVLPDLTESVSITGPGANSLTVRRNAGGNYRIFTVNTTGPVTFSGLTISNGFGGIINASTATVTVTNCVISDNSTTGLGGAIFNMSTGALNVTDSTLSRNAAGRGGAIFNNSAATVTLTNATLSGNVASGSTDNAGGGLCNNGTGTVNITNSRLAGNHSTASGTDGARGGGVYNESGTVTITNTPLESNSVNVPNSTAEGGGIFNKSGIVNIANCTLFSNGAGDVSGPNSSITAVGGGIYNDTGTVNLTNSTLNNNFAFALGSSGQFAVGGGFFNNTGTANVTNSTVSGNFCSGFGQPTMFGGGIVNNAGMVRVKSTIIALNTVNAQDPTGSGPDVVGVFTSQGFNLIGKRDAGAGFTQPTDQTGTESSPLDPKFDGGAAFNGGPNVTLALRPGSPAIDKGSSQCLTCGSNGVLVTDERGSGFPRTLDDPRIPNATGGDGTDIGAFELQTLSPTLANVSTRLRVEIGDNVLIGGFIVTGTQPKKVILRAIGPSLPFADKLANPTLELFGPSGLIASNDDWQSSTPADKQAIINSTIAPANDLESAIVRTLPANNTGYTAIVRGVNNGTGIGLVEAFDLDRTVDSKLANISTRGLVQTGDNVLIAGTIILGSQEQKVMVRGIGPSLAVPGKLADPTLELRDRNGSLFASNDNWVDSPNKQAIIDSGIPPGDDKESAIVQILPANGAGYTAILRGVNDTTGIAVVEVYALN